MSAALMTLLLAASVVCIGLARLLPPAPTSTAAAVRLLDLVGTILAGVVLVYAITVVA